MDNLIKSSLIYRFLSKIAALLRNGMFASIGAFFSRCYGYSHTKVVYGRFVSRENSAVGSRFVSLLSRLRDALRRLFIPFYEIYRKSALSKACKAVWRGISSILSGSVFSGVFEKLNARRLMLVLLALYLPIDYILRSVLSIVSLASVWDEAFMLAVILYLFCDLVIGKSSKDPVMRVTPIDGYLLLFICVGFFLMCAVSPYMSIAIDGYRAVVQYMLWFFLAVRLIRDDGDLLTFFYVLLALSAAMALHGIYQYIVATPIPAGWITSTEAGVRTRVFSITGSPNIFGSFLVMTAPMCAALAYYLKPLWQKLAAWAVTGVMLMSLLFTFSRGAWGGIAVAIVIFAIYADKRLLAVLSAGIFAALLFVPSISDRLTYLFTEEYTIASQAGGRGIRWETGRILLNNSNPLLGFGLGRFGGAVAMQNKIIEETETFEYFYMDNYYLKTAVEMGYIGLFFFILLLLGLIVWSMRSAGKYPADRMSFLVQGMLAGMCGVLVHCYFENIFEVPYMTAYFWICAACIMYFGFFRNGKYRGDGNG